MRQISIAELQIIYVDISLCKLHSDFFPKCTVWKWGKKSNLPVEKTGKYYIGQVTKVNINSHKSCWSYVFLIGCDINGRLLFLKWKKKFIAQSLKCLLGWKDDSSLDQQAEEE